MCHRCVVAALSVLTDPRLAAKVANPDKYVGVDYAKDSPEAGQAQQADPEKEPENHPAGNIETRLEDAYATVKRRERQIEQIRQDNDFLKRRNNALVEEMQRVNGLKHKYAREAQVAKEFAKILTADMAPQL